MLGCGTPPTRDDEDERWGWRCKELPSGRLSWTSPTRAIAAGRPAYEGLGFGSIVCDWPWCPRWYIAYSDARIDGQRPWEFFATAWSYREKGELADLIPAPWTPALVEGLALLNALEVEKVRQDAAERAAETERKQR